MAAAIEAVRALLEREGTNISWAHLTFNPWIGCTKVSPACDHCYAETLATNRLGVGWGPNALRRRTSAGNWAKPRRWQRIAAAAGVSLRVFCASLADWADKAVDPQWRLDLADLIRATPNITWMLLTKRIPNVEAMLRAMFPEGVPPNVWLGITVVTQVEADRDVPRAIAVKQALGIRRLFLSMEPLLGPVDLTPWLASIDMVIVGGESGTGARPMHPVWALEIGHQCWVAKVPFHFKQWGDWQPIIDTGMRAGTVYMHGRKYKGDRIFHFPEDTQPMVRVGAKLAGRMVAGREWLEVPTSSTKWEAFAA
jgi:protein gp37